MDNIIRLLLIDTGKIRPEENFYPIDGFPDYLISPYGQVYSIKSQKILKPFLCHDYYNVTLFDNGFKQTTPIHRLVAIHFIPNPLNKPHVNHIDHDNHNNIYSNLEWVTVQEHKEITKRAIKERGTLVNPKRKRKKRK